MSEMHILYKLHEIQLLDETDENIEEYQQYLPHAKELLNEAVESWNSLPMHEYFDGILENKIRKAHATGRIDKDGNAILDIQVVGIPNFRFTAPVRDEIDEQVGIQFCDGWGESFFGSCNMYADGSIRYYAD